MTVRDYCNAAYSIIVEEHRRHGATLVEALDKLREWATERWSQDNQREEVVTAEVVARANDRALRQLRLPIPA